MWYRLEAGKVVETFTTQPVFHPSLMAQILDLPDGGLIGDYWDGTDFNTPPPLTKLEGGAVEPTLEQLLVDPVVGLKYLEKQLEQHVAAEIESRGYGSWNAIAVYALATGTGALKTESQSLIDWRSDVFELAIDLAEDVEAGNSPPPTWPELQAMLPVVPPKRVKL